MVSTFLKTGFFLSLFCLSFLSNADANQICDGAELTEAAWSFDEHKVRRLRKDLTEPRNAGVSLKEMKQRIEARIKRYYTKTKGVTASQMAETIANIAICTGNDFTYLTAIFEQETKFCFDIGNGKNGSGCGQLTGEAINEMKSQMRLPGQQRKNNANKDVTEYLNSTVNSCATQLGNREIAEQFYKRYTQPTANVLGALRKGNNLTTDMLMSALVLKFYTAKQGGYVVKGKTGGIAKYNGGGTSGYAGNVINKAKKVDFTCYEDNYTPSIQERACLIGTNPEKCATETIDDGSVAI
jgi:hypothetical protein